MIDFTFRPIDVWTWHRTPEEDRRAPFRNSWSDTLSFLENELSKIDGENLAILLDVDEQHINRDGSLSKRVVFKSPAVILVFNSRHGALKLPCDACLDWQHNARAIAYHLMHLRESARYGVGSYGEQYRGWKALPAPLLTEPPMTREEAAQFIASFSPWSNGYANEILKSIDKAAFWYRAAAMKLHPDANGGIHRPEWDKLQKAKAVLGV